MEGLMRKAALSIAVRVLLSCIALIFFASCSSTPKDESLQDDFKRNLSKFEALRDMIINEPEITSIGNDNVEDFWLNHGKWTTHSPPYTKYSEEDMLNLVGLSKERYNTYLGLLEAVGGYRVTKEWGMVIIHIYRSGNVSSGITKNIVFSQESPSPVVDEAVLDKNALDIYYLRIIDNWYLEVERS
jgi:hypothetical protein